MGVECASNRVGLHHFGLRTEDEVRIAEGISLTSLIREGALTGSTRLSAAA